MPREPFPTHVPSAREQRQAADVIEAVRCIVAGAILAVVFVGILWAAPALHAWWAS